MRSALVPLRLSAAATAVVLPPQPIPPTPALTPVEIESIPARARLFLSTLVNGPIIMVDFAAGVKVIVGSMAHDQPLAWEFLLTAHTAGPALHQRFRSELLLIMRPAYEADRSLLEQIVKLVITFLCSCEENATSVPRRCRGVLLFLMAKEPARTKLAITRSIEIVELIVSKPKSGSLKEFRCRHPQIYQDVSDGAATCVQCAPRKS